MTTFAEKLKSVAHAINRAHAVRLFALIPFSPFPDQWDLLISSDSLGRDGNRFYYVVAQLKKVLTSKEMLKISQIVFLPATHPLVANAQPALGAQPDPDLAHETDDLEEATIIWPPKRDLSEIQTASAR